MPETTGADGGLIDHERFRAVAADCDWTLAELHRFFVDGTRDQILELRGALATGDAREVERLAHSCVGSSATCGINGLVEIFRALEHAASGGEIGSGEAALAEIERRMAVVDRALAELAAD